MNEITVNIINQSPNMIGNITGTGAQGIQGAQGERGLTGNVITPGVESGLAVTAQVVPNMSVAVEAGVADVPGGAKYTLAGTNVTITAADGVDDRTDIIYISSAGAISYLEGVSASGQPTTPAGGLLLYAINVEYAATAIHQADIIDKRVIAISLDAIKADITANKAYISKNTLAISTLEQTLANSNPNNDPRITITTADTIVSFPKNAANGGLQTIIRGMTQTNLIVNGDFSNGTTPWNTDKASFSAVNGVATITADGTSLATNLFQYISDNRNGHVHSIKLKARVTNSNCLAIRVIFGGAVPYEFLPEINVWYDINYIVAIPLDSIPNYIEIKQIYADAATANGKVMEIQQVMTIDLTAHGLQAKTAADMALIAPNYFSGTQHNTVTRLRSVGKNLFDKNTVTNGYYVNTANGNLISYNNTVFSSAYECINQAKQYIFSYATDAAYYDVNKIFISGDGIKAITTPINACYIRFTGTSISRDTLQLELGTVETAYMPYVESSMYIEPYELRKTNADVYDEITADGDYQQRVDTDDTALAVIPAPIKNVTNGVLTSFLSGTFYVERALLDVGFYTTNFSISRTGYPIKTLETLYKVNQQTGEETPLDVSLAVITSGGLTLTHPQLADGDLATGSYFWDYAGVNGVNDYSYIDNRTVVLDSVTGKYYKMSFTVTNDVIALIKTEIL